MDTGVELTAEQKLAIEKRKVRLQEERHKATMDRQARARRRVVDTEATAKLLLKERKVSKNWIDRKTPEELRKYVKVACIAHEIDPISVLGTRIEWISLLFAKRY